MLTIEALNATKDLVAILADKGVSLKVVDGSPVGEAMAATKIWGNKLDCLSGIDKLPESLYNDNKPQMQGSDVIDDLHGGYMEAASTQLGIALAGHVSFATTVVLPAVSDLHNKLKSIMDLESTCGIRSYKVEMVTGSALFDVPAVVSEIEKFGSLQAAAEQPLVLDYKDLSDEELVKLMKVGAQAYDDAVDLFVANEGIETIREVWTVVFSNDRQNFKNYDDFRSDRVKGLARNFATFLISTRLLTMPDQAPEVTGLSGLSSSKYTFILKGLQEVSGAALYVAFEFKQSQDKTGKLIDKVDKKCVYVNKSVFDRFMADGGDIETILGAVISGDKKVYVEDIVENIEKYKLAWTYHVTLAKQNAESSMLIDIRRGISDFVRTYVRTAEDDVVKANVTKILDNTNEFVSHVYNPELKDIDILAMKAVCKCIYNHTDSIEILRGVNEAMTNNPDISKEDALNLSVLNYVACWFADQIDIA